MSETIPEAVSATLSTTLSTTTADCFFHTIEGFNPEPVVQKHCCELQSISIGQRLLCISYPFEVYWLADKPLRILSALYYLEKNDQQVDIRFTVTDSADALTKYIENSHEEGALALFTRAHEHFSLAVFSTNTLLSLSSINIAKPWGQEVWYTGVEERGVAEFSDGAFQLPLPWVLSALPSSLCADLQQSLILLKILDPLPEEVFGDLYFELHQQKREVYVVTAVDQDAWPTGKGEIRFGFDQDKRQQYESDAAFRRGFVAAVKAYQDIRETIDSILDEYRLRDDVELNAPVSAGVLAEWLQEVPAQLLAEERLQRSHMDAFTNTLPLRVGDVVKVPCLTPHSLQHGVRTIEFQTPVYERLILSFAQKVLTQSHWDTDAAARIMSLDYPEPPAHDCLVTADGVLVERIVDFNDFEVLRISLHSGCSFHLETPASYSLLIAVKGAFALDDHLLSPEQAALLPATWPGGDAVNHSAETINFLLANPKS